MRRGINFFLIGLLTLILLSTISFSIPVLVVEETELVKVEADTFDPDGDNISMIYSAPLDENGEWQTDYGDAGNYTTSLTASDGEGLTKQEFMIVVKKKNKAPSIEIEPEIEAEETDLIKLGLRVVDANNDEIDVSISEPFEDGEWQTGYEDAGEYTITITATDGDLESTKLVKIIVNEKNRPPRIISAEPEREKTSIKENEAVDFLVRATDLDEDEIVFLWELDGEIVGWEESYSYQTDFESSGNHVLKLIVSDGIDETTKFWDIEVENVNRPPVLPELDNVKIEEGELLVLELPETDVDGDELTYYIDEPIGDDKEWQTDYEDAGEYEIEIEVTDGEFEDETFFTVIVENVDRPPRFEEMEPIEINESGLMQLELKAFDPDGDEISYLAYGFPEGAILEGDEIIWEPGYDFVQKPDNFVVDFLGKLRVDKYFWKSKIIEVSFAACSNSLCANKTTEIKVHNVNRKPQLWVADEIVINETDKLQVKPQSEDLDNDYVKFYFTEPLNENGEWQTGYEEAGEYWATVGATDGKESVEEIIKITVNERNRKPKIGKISDRKVNEGEDVWIKVDTDDSDNDELDLWVEGAPAESSFEKQTFYWKPGYDTVTERKGKFHDWLSNFAWLNRKLSQEKQNFDVYFAVSDGDFIVSRLVNIVVRNWNRAPEIVNSSPNYVEARVGEPVFFSAEVVDPDGDELNYEWSFGFMQGKVKNAESIRRTFTSTGEKKVSLEISDGRDFIEQEWRIRVLPKLVEQQVAEPEPEPAVQPVFKTYVV